MGVTVGNFTDVVNEGLEWKVHLRIFGLPYDPKWRKFHVKVFYDKGKGKCMTFKRRTRITGHSIVYFVHKKVGVVRQSKCKSLNY